MNLFCITSQLIFQMQSSKHIPLISIGNKNGDESFFSEFFILLISGTKVCIKIIRKYVILLNFLFTEQRNYLLEFAYSGHQKLQFRKGNNTTCQNGIISNDQHDQLLGVINEQIRFYQFNQHQPNEAKITNQK